MDRLMAPAIVLLTDSALAAGRVIREALDGAQIHGLTSRVSQRDVGFENAADHLRTLFAEGRPVIAVFSAGAVIRILAPVLEDKLSEPPVISVSEDGASIVPLLGGHRGANGLARQIAALLDGHAAITTAGDVRFDVALDQPPEGWVLANPEAAKPVMADLLAGSKVELVGSAPWLTASDLPLADSATLKLTVTHERRDPGFGELLYHPRVLSVGVGCERGCDPDELTELVHRTLQEAGFAEASVSVIASVDVKADEAAVHAVARSLGAAARFFDAARLEQESPRLQTPSDIVFAEVGCHGVAEGAALAAAGSAAKLIVAKQKSARATCAVALAPAPIDASTVGRSRGILSVIGLGPGKDGWRSPEATRLVCEARDVVGYTLYIDLLGSLAEGKTRHDFPLGGEEDRVRHALELAGEGRNVALVCSGDAGIYAMAALVYELLDRDRDKGGVSAAARRSQITVSPGISALQAAAAVAGAPLGHDFCTISLSDLLTPWQVIEQRVEAAGRGDFVIAFYNPVSMRRRTQLARARDILLAHRPAATPVILATNLGRPGQACRVVTLGDLCIDDVDMLTVVVVGSSETRVLERGDGSTNVYTPRGYAVKLEESAAQ